MHHKSFEIFIQHRFSKLLLLDKFYPFSDGQDFGGGVRSLSKFFFYTFNVCIAKNKEKHIQDYFHTNVDHQKSFLKKPGLVEFIIDPKASQSYTKGLPGKIINLLGSDIHWFDL